MKLAHIHNKQEKLEPIWHVQIAVLIAMGLQLFLDSRLTVGPKYVIAGFELLLMLLLAFLGPRTRRLTHLFAAILISLITVANMISLGLVLHSLFGGDKVTGKELIASGIGIYLTNIIIFGLWYWELDGGGLSRVLRKNAPMPDFLFQQMNPTVHAVIGDSWRPTFFDYLFLSISTATNFSPSDTYPLTHRAKLLMAIQILISLLTIALVAARAVGILA